MKALEESQMPNTHRSVLLNHIRPAPRNKLGRLSETLLVQFGAGTSKYFGWHHRVLEEGSQSIGMQMVRRRELSHGQHRECTSEVHKGEKYGALVVISCGCSTERRHHIPAVQCGERALSSGCGLLDENARFW
ncbi:hypothetical protein, unlikely [Trypanosoma congolense IL3000]|uniref:Uncharacterized protein n=1 Tax=Trypanosoma congolense (strain IL3000) TaxID=1068625 RepID=F9WFU2_TRYCI|nr:hypothetical protein, unlikely [Trypanosoma congolense IL3000]